MVVSILHIVVDLPHVNSLKEKRQIVQPVKMRLQNKFKISVAEVDQLDSLRVAEIGAVVISNSRQYGESVMNKALQFVEGFVPGRIRDTSIFSELY